jgi:hypothetical protein
MVLFSSGTDIWLFSLFGIRPDTGYKKGRISGASLLVLKFVSCKIFKFFFSLELYLLYIFLCSHTSATTKPGADAAAAETTSRAKAEPEVDPLDFVKVEEVEDTNIRLKKYL